MNAEQKKRADEAWMHAAMKTSQFSSNSHNQDKDIFLMGFEAGLNDLNAKLETAREALKLAEEIMLRNSMFPGDIHKFREALKEIDN